ncbi:tape measure protein [Nocardia nepalensis]|uniref:tape measure protein n=1 Tax=Nocardia nepalensis TaxID=3375448 RepID=UPI003B6760C3
MTTAGVNLATGYVSLVPETSKVAPGVEGAFVQAQGSADKAGRSLGSRFASGFGAVFKTAVTAGGIGAALFGGTALKSGLDRLTTIQNATTSLTTIMGDATQAGQLMDQIKKTVNGTPFNLDQFATVGKNLVAMNVPAAKVPGYLTAIGEAAAASGKGADGVEQVSAAFGKMAATGKVSLDQVWSVAEAGVPALAILANGFGVTTAQMQKMISKGAVPADKAMDILAKGIMEGSDGAAGATKAYAGTMAGLRQTLSGASGGFKAAMARFGAGILAPWLPVATTTLTGLAGGLDTLTPKIQAFSQRLADSQAVEKFTGWMTNLPATIERVTNSIGEFDFSKLTTGFTTVTDSLTKIGEAGGAGKDSGFLSSLTSGLAGLGGALGNLGVDTITVLTAALGSMSDILGVLADHTGLVTPLLIGLAAAYAASQTAQTAYQIAKVVQTPAMFAQIVVQRQLTGALAQHTAALTANTAATGVNTGVQNTQTATTLRAKVAALASAAASRVAAAAQCLWNAALSGNPIVLIIAAIAALVAGLVWFFTQTDTGRAIWETVWGAIQSAIAVAWSYIKPIWDGFLDALGWVGDKLLWLWSEVVSPVFGFIGSLIGTWWSGVQVYFAAWKTALGAAGDVVSWWWSSVVSPVFGFIGSLISAWWSTVQVVFAGWKAALGAAGDVVSWLWSSVVSPVFGFIGDLISSIWTGTIQPAWTAFTTAIDVLGTVFSAMWTEHIKPAWEGFQAGFQTGWELIKSAIDTGKKWFEDLRDTVERVVGKIAEYWDRVKGIVGKVTDVAGRIGTAVTSVIPGLAAGGSVAGPGGPTSDSVVARLSAGEHVVTAREVSAVGGQPAMYRLRAAMRSGALRFAAGGAVPRGIRDALAAARAVSGNPYDWGGFGPDRFDCSGFIGFLQRVAMGMADPAVRLYTTLDLLAGRLAGLKVGFGPAGTLFQVGANADHMAATINGQPAEAGGSHGTSRLGSPAVGASDPQFTHAFHLPNELIAGWAEGASSTGTTGKNGKKKEWTDADQTNLESAQVSVEQAKQRRDKVYADEDKSDADRRQADLAVEKAEQKVLGLQQRKDDAASGKADGPAPQAPALERKFSEDELARIDAQAAVDSANTRRNEVYADPEASAGDRLKADAELSRAQSKLDELGNSDSKIQGRVRDFVTDAAGIAFDAFLQQLPFGLGETRWWTIDYAPLIAAGQSAAQKASEAIGPLPSFSPEAIAAQLGYTPVAGQPPPEWWDKLRPRVFDSGGWLMPGETAINLSRRPEPVLSSPGQLQAFMGGFAAEPALDASVRIENLTTGMSAAEFRREWALMQLDQRQRAKTWQGR